MNRRKTLHAFWALDSHVMSLWLEEWTPEPRVPALPGQHPGCGSFAHLRQELPRELELFEEERVALLPSLPGAPLPSEPCPPAAELRPWALSTGESILECFLEYLYGAPLGKAPARGPQWGDSLHYWRLAAEFARGLREGRRFAPGVAGIESRCYPAWQAVFDADAEADFRVLLEAMPPCCLALRLDGDEELRQAQADPVRLTLSFLDNCLDHLLRQDILRRNPRLQTRRKSRAPLYRQWLKSLRAGQLAALAGEDAEVQVFGDQVKAWIEFLRPSGFDLPWRAGFVLREPAQESGRWRLDFQLCAAKNPALAIAAERIWAAGPDDPVSRSLPEARELLLADLGAAARLYPPLREALREPHPRGLDLDHRQAYEFLTLMEGELRRYGFPVHLPDWWREQRLQLRAQVGINPSGGRDRPSFLGVNEVVAFQWRLALGEHGISLEEFQDLVQQDTPLLHFRGRWVRLDTRSLRRAHEFFTRYGATGRDSLARVLRLGSQLDRLVPGMTVELRLEQILATQKKLAETDLFAEVPVPASFQGTLRPYQEKGLAWLLKLKEMRLGACLADDMGLGKTIQIIAMLLAERGANPARPPSLVVCPMSVVGNWVRELQRFAPSLRVLVHHGSDRDGPEDFRDACGRHDLVVTTYALVVRDLSIFGQVEWDNLILDEAQNIKNPATKQARAIGGLRAGQRYCLTGTPVENRLTELWSIMNFLNPGYLGNLTAFRRVFSVPIERERDRGRAELLQHIIRPFVLRRLKSDREIIRDLPEKQEMRIYCNLTAEQAILYQQVVDDMLERIRTSDGMARRGQVLAALVKLKKVTNHPRHFLGDDSVLAPERSGKLQRLEEMLEDILAEKDKALIFSQFTEIGDAMRQELAVRFGVDVLYMHGGTPKARRDEMIQRFQEADGPPLFLLSLKTGGIGLNLTAACHVFHFDRWWNPAIEDQATDRAFRIGQRRNVQVHKFVCVGTVEEKIDQMIEEKKRLADNVVGSGEELLTELSTDELRAVFELTSDAVVE